jgi:hypothetical protein
MEWMDTVYFAEYDEQENTIEKLKPYGTDHYFYEDELSGIENTLSEALEKQMTKAKES